MPVYLNSMANSINDSAYYINSNDADDIKHIQESAKQAIKNTEIFYDHYYKTLSIIPPNKLIKAHTAWLNVYYEVFSTWEKLVMEFEKSINNPPKDGKIDLDIRYEGNSIKLFEKEINKVKGGCFIISATYGSSLAKEVDVFRNYRDDFLSNSSYGIKIINTYYNYSPFFSNIILKSNMMKKGVQKIILNPLLFILKKRVYGNE